LPSWIDRFLQSQPALAMPAILADPNEKFIVMTCHKFKHTFYEACGGFTDRLFLLPYYVWLAHKSGRRLLIKYSKPMPLEVFLVPPPAPGGFDWRLPDGLYPEFDRAWAAYANRSWTEYRNWRRISLHEEIEKKPALNAQRIIFVNTNLAIPKVGGHFEKVTGLQRDDVWPGLFRRMFGLSGRLAESVNQIAKEFSLKPGAYGSVHVRAKFPVGRGDLRLRRSSEKDGRLDMQDETTRIALLNLSQVALGCAHKAIEPETKHQSGYVASDSQEIMRLWFDDKNDVREDLQNMAGTHIPLRETKKWVRLASRPNRTEQVAHFDQPGRHRWEYDGTIIDLWMLAHAKCISQGLGGFGHFGSVLSGNHLRCRVRHRDYVLGLLPSCPTPSALKVLKNLSRSSR